MCWIVEVVEWRRVLEWGTKGRGEGVESGIDMALMEGLGYLYRCSRQVS